MTVNELVSSNGNKKENNLLSACKTRKWQRRRENHIPERWIMKTKTARKTAQRILFSNNIDFVLMRFLFSFRRFRNFEKMANQEEKFLEKATGMRMRMRMGMEMEMEMLYVII